MPSSKHSLATRSRRKSLIGGRTSVPAGVSTRWADRAGKGQLCWLHGEVEEGDGRMEGMRVGGMAGEVLHAHSDGPVLYDAASTGCDWRVLADGPKGGRG